MLRRRFIVRHHTTFTQRDAGVLCACPAVMTSYVGIFSASSPLRAPTRTTKRIKAHGVIKRGHVEPASQWTWSFASQFTDLVHDPTLSLPKAPKMEPSMQVFSNLDIDEKKLYKPPKGKHTFDHCNIEGVMKANGFMPELDKRALLAASSAERKLMLAEFKEQARKVDKILEDNRRMVDELADALHDGRNRTKRSEPQIHTGAERFLMLCGFDDRIHFKVENRGCGFGIFGKQCHSEGDWYVVESVDGNKDLVLVFEDKSQFEGARTVPSEGHLGEIVCEVLEMLMTNRDRGAFRSIFGMRYINNGFVSGFRVDANRRTLHTLATSRAAPKSKLQLLCTEENPMKSRGLSLIDKTQRLEALNLMANIRNFILEA